MSRVPGTAGRSSTVTTMARCGAPVATGPSVAASGARKPARSTPARAPRGVRCIARRALWFRLPMLKMAIEELRGRVVDLQPARMAQEVMDLIRDHQLLHLDVPRPQPLVEIDRLI